ncbi:MAG TPA: hypothetical protein VJZ04_07320 [Lachnospiraceae bacterium]|nr:hypothetical protein [Lachnospiraceae bacterium]
MKPNNHAQNKHTFEGLSRKIQRHQTSNYYDELKRQEVIFFYLFVRKMEQFYTVDKYYITEMFYNVLGLAVNIIDKKHVFILRLVKYTKLLFLWNKLRLKDTAEFNINQTTLKPAICNKQAASFLLTKYLYFRPKVIKTIYLFLHLFRLDLGKPYFFKLLKHSSGCRSPPFISDFLN